MRKLYQKEWHAIPFTDLPPYDRCRLADGKFYEAFYNELFRRYRDWSDLDDGWVRRKLQVVEFLLDRCRGARRILSVGCGIGIIEKELLHAGIEGLEVQETSETALRWIRQLLPARAVHVGPIARCLDQSTQFDLIYVSGIDYCFGSDEWTGFLRQIRDRLSPGARCVILSVSVDDGGAGRAVKDLVKAGLIMLRLIEPGQWWGWKRTREELRASLRASGMQLVEDGFLGTGKGSDRRIYWLEGGAA